MSSTADAWEPGTGSLPSSATPGVAESCDSEAHRGHTGRMDKPVGDAGTDIPGPGCEGWAQMDWFMARWPTSAGRAEFNGGPYWSGGPWDHQDLEAAERLYPGRVAVLGANGDGLWVLANEEEAERVIERLGPGARRLRRS